ncbi:MAG: hypothetical protein MRJ92_01920 [Nitrospira sp.]|nr:hypothetical protein [Nitrospira sp.]
MPFSRVPAERAVQACSLLRQAWVMRDGQQQQIARSELVPGDVRSLLEEGEQIPADARLTEAIGMRVDQFVAHRRSKPNGGSPNYDGHPLDIPSGLHGYRSCPDMVRVVFATGLTTEFGNIANLTATVRTGLSPLQQEIVNVTHVVAGLSRWPWG